MAEIPRCPECGHLMPEGVCSGFLGHSKPVMPVVTDHPDSANPRILHDTGGSVDKADSVEPESVGRLIALARGTRSPAVEGSDVGLNPGPQPKTVAVILLRP